jgi:hypothetical protein
MGTTVDLVAVRESRARLAKLAKDNPGLRAPTLAELAEAEAEYMGRLADSVLSDLDTFVERWRAGNPGVAFTRSDAVRMFVMRALAEAAEAPHKGRKP